MAVGAAQSLQLLGGGVLLAIGSDQDVARVVTLGQMCLVLGFPSSSFNHDFLRHIRSRSLGRLGHVDDWLL